MRFHQPKRPSLAIVKTNLWSSAHELLINTAERLDTSRSLIGRLTVASFEREHEAYLGSDPVPTFDEIQGRYTVDLSGQPVNQRIGFAIETAHWRWIAHIDTLNDRSACNGATLRAIVAWKLPELAVAPTTELVRSVEELGIRADGRSGATS